MDRSTRYHLCSWLSYFVVGLASLLGSSAARAEDGTYSCNKRDFKIPYVIDNPNLRGIYLYVSQDLGRTYTWVKDAMAGPQTPPDKRYFVYHAPADGVYWFVCTTLDSNNQFQPIDPRLVQPSLKVHVDTEPPRIVEFSQVEGAPAAVKWLINDEGFASLSLDYRVQGTAEWYPIPDPAQSASVPRQVFNPVIGGALEVRLRVQDKGGNVAERVISVTAGAVRPGAAPPAQAAAEGGTSDIHYVNSKTFQLNFSIDKESTGPSGIDHVDVWVLRKGIWQKREPIRKLSEPHTFEVPNEGRWGFTLVPVSGVGLSAPTPKPGDPPQTWVEVDVTKPVVQIREAPVVTPGQDAGSSYVTITWSASDTFLRREPITLSYSDKPDGGWQPLPGVPASLPNTGSHRVETQGLPFQFYIQVKAVDEAGNEGSAVTTQPVKVDLRVPRIKSLEARPAQAGAGEQRGGFPFSQ